MKKSFLYCVFVLLFCVDVFSLSPEEEYDFLIKDLYNYSTYGYKRNFDTKQDKSDGIIDFSQGNLQQTNNYLDIAIQGKGFFRVKDNSGNIYYTRYGKLGYDNESCSLYILVKDSKYFLDIKPLPKYSLLYDEIRILRDGSVECSIPEETANEFDNVSGSIPKKRNGWGGKIVVTDKDFNETVKIPKKEVKKEIIDKIILYDIENVNVESYDGYLIKTKVSPDIINNPHFTTGALEMSNVLFDEVLIRMLFVIEKVDDSKIKQKEIKKYLIQKMLDPNFVRVKLFGYFYEQYPRIDDISGLTEYVHFLERSYE